MAELSTVGPSEATRVPRVVIATIALGSMLAPLNSTMIAVALPDVRADFDVSHGAIGWLISAYLVTMAVSQPVAGRLGDQVGRGRVYRFALLAFLLFSLLAAISPTFEALVAFRTGQAMAGAALVPNGMAILRASVSTRRLGRVNGMMDSLAAFSAASAPLIGAALLAVGPWRLLFLLNVPIVGLAALLAWTGRFGDDGERAAARLDIRGIALMALLLITGTILLNGSAGRPSDPSFAAGVVALVALTLVLVRSQRGARTRFAAWELFRLPAYSAATGYALLTNLVLYTTLLAIPFFITEFQGRASTTTGVLLGAMSIGIAVVAPVGGWLADTWGRRLPSLLGATVALAAAAAVIVALDPDTSFILLAAALAAFGFGIGLGAGPATTAAIEAAPLAEAARAGGTMAMARYTGSILGAGILAGVLESGADAAPGLATFRVIFFVVAIMTLAAIFASLRIHRFPAEARA